MRWVQAFFLINIFFCSSHLFGLEANETIVDSDTLLVVREEGIDHFYFEGNVKLEADSLSATSDFLHVMALGEGGSEISMPSMQSIQQLIATGSVWMLSEGREATAGRADIDPNLGTMVLTEDDPQITDAEQGIVRGDKITIFKDSKKIIVDGGEHQSRPSVYINPDQFGSESSEAQLQ